MIIPISIPILDSLGNFRTNSLAYAPLEEIAAIEGIGPEIAQAVKDWYRNGNNQFLLTQLQQA
ncbi:MAG: helix-hairpin-helix domain-containing protein, partial [Synechococcales cyanobacterium]